MSATPSDNLGTATSIKSFTNIIDKFQCCSWHRWCNNHLAAPTWSVLAPTLRHKQQHKSLPSHKLVVRKEFSLPTITKSHQILHAQCGHCRQILKCLVPVTFTHTYLARWNTKTITTLNTKTISTSHTPSSSPLLQFSLPLTVPDISTHYPAPKSTCHQCTQKNLKFDGTRKKHWRLQRFGKNGRPLRSASKIRHERQQLLLKWL